MCIRDSVNADRLAADHRPERAGQEQRHVGDVGRAHELPQADAGQFQTGGEGFNTDMGIPQSVIDDIDAQGGITGGGLVYGETSAVQEFVTEDYYRSVWSRWNDPETLDLMVASKDRNEDGLLSDRAQLYGMEQFPLNLSLIHI